MAEFLVEIEIRLPPDLAPGPGAELEQAEREAGAALRRSGALQRIWRVPGRRANVGVWRAQDATELHRLLSSLPMAPWMETRVRPLATHPLEELD